MAKSANLRRFSDKFSNFDSKDKVLSKLLTSKVYQLNFGLQNQLYVASVVYQQNTQYIDEIIWRIPLTKSLKGICSNKI